MQTASICICAFMRLKMVCNMLTFIIIPSVPGTKLPSDGSFALGIQSPVTIRYITVCDESAPLVESLYLWAGFQTIRSPCRDSNSTLPD